MTFWKNKKVIAVLLGLLTAVFLSLAALFGALSNWELQFSNFLYQPSNPSGDIIIIGVDDQSLDEFGEFSRWSRGKYARVVDILAQYEPKVIAFDFYFLAPRDAQGDELFAESLKNAGVSVITGLMSSSIALDKKGNVVAKDMVPPLFSDIPNVTPASINTLLDEDGVLRRFPVMVTDEETGKASNTFTTSVVQAFTGRVPAIPTEDGQMLINYYSRPSDDTKSETSSSDYPFYSFRDVYNGTLNFDLKTLKDKIILIGPTADAFGDNFLTPLSSTHKLSGVEIRANSIQTILDQKFLRYLSISEKILLILLLSFGAAYFFMFTRIRWSLLFLIAIPTLYTLAAFPLFNVGIIADMVHPFVAIFIAFISVYMYRYTTEFREKRELKGAFSRYVNPGVVEAILKNPDQLKLGGEKREVTVLFTDIAHFTTISESMKPESLVALLNEYFEAMSEVIMSEGGTLDKFEGDAIMAFFGAPLEEPDHAVRACNASIKMRQRMSELLQKWQSDPPLPGGEKKPQIDFRCGISSGDVIVGNIGSSEKLEYTVIGDIVNLGSRLESANKKYVTNAMISEATYEKVKDRFEARELDIIKVVGKSKPIRVYELLNYKGQMTPEAANLLKLFNEGIQLYHGRKFAEGLAKFNEILKVYPQDGPSKLYRQRCEVLRDFPPSQNWDGVYEMGTK